MNTTAANGNGGNWRDDYARQLRELSDEQLREEWRDYRCRYDPLRTELAQRRLAARDLHTGKLSHLIGNQRLRETVAKLTSEMNGHDQ
jgi:ribosomal protein L29